MKSGILSFISFILIFFYLSAAFSQDYWDLTTKDVEDIQFFSPAPNQSINLNLTEKARLNAELFWKYLPTIIFSELTDIEKIAENIIKKYSKKKHFDLNKKDGDINEIFYIISTTSFGRNFLPLFLPLYFDRQVVVSYDLEPIKTLQGLPVRAVYRSGKIQFTKDMEKFGLTYNLVHEGTHALDFAGKNDDYIVSTFMDFCDFSPTLLSEIIHNSKAFYEINDPLSELLYAFYNLFPNLILQGDSVKNINFRISKFKLDFAYIMEVVSMLLIASEHRAYRYQQQFLDELNMFNDDTWNARLLFNDPENNEIRPFDKKAFIQTMKSIYTIPDIYYSKYFATITWEDLHL